MKTKHTHAGRKRFSAGGLLSPANTLDRNLAVARFGKAVRSAKHEAILRLVGLFDKRLAYSQREREISRPFCERRFDEIARPMLLDALERQDPQPFRDFAAAIEEAQRIRAEGPIQPFHARLLCFAAAVDVKFSPGKTIPFTALQLKATMKLPQSVEYVRRECKRVGVGLLPDKVCRPRKLRTIPARRKS